MIVCKFGGTSVQNKDAIERVIGIIKSRLKERPVVVVSAFSKVTRQLCELADEAEAKHESNVEALIGQIRERHNTVASEMLSDNKDLLNHTSNKVGEICDELEAFVKGICQIGELSPRSNARIISTGELLSSTIISAAMNSRGVKSRWVDARKMIITNDDYLSARPDMEATQSNVLRIIGEEAKGVDIVLTQGFIASSASGATTVLGFEGSDYSAAIIAMSLNASKVEIWTDVDGIRTADPRVVHKTSRIDRISYEEAAEMAYLGARVLHPLTIEPARKKNIPIRVLNSGNTECEGSSVVRDDSIPDGPKSIAFRDDIYYIELSSRKLAGETSMLSGIFGILKSHKIEAFLVSTKESKVSITVEAGHPELEEAMEELSELMEMTVYRDKAQISIVGKNVLRRDKLIEDMASVTGKIYMVSIGAGLMNISFVIDRDRLAESVDGLHKKLF